MKKKRIYRKKNLYQKFALVMIILGLLPMLILSTFIVNSMIKGYRQSMQANYEQAARHMTSSVENMLISYNTASKMAYQYNFEREVNLYTDQDNYDNLRRVLYGEIYGEDVEVWRETEMRQFLNNIEKVDNYIYAVHFLTDNEDIGKLDFHFSVQNTYFREEEIFEKRMDYANWNKTSKELILIPTHVTDYFNGLEKQVFTAARNYYDLRGTIGNEKYIGTIFIDVDIEKLKQIFKKMNLGDEQDYYLVNEKNDCFYSSRKECIGINLEEKGMLPEESKESLIIQTEENEFGLKIIMEVDTRDAFAQISFLHISMYLFLFSSAVALMLASFYFSRRLTRPIHNMMEQMGKVESGNFDIELPVESEDEIGVLSERFNRMSHELKNYINQSYVAQIKQNEAELTALRSQIYPHFLYNTLEIIRMTALENDDLRVSEMIEALSEQIHYLIGPVHDMVSLEKEIDIVEKYVYLLNCRISGKITLVINAPGSREIMVPRLILQPIVENAYVHGIKPKNGRGSIMIEMVQKQNIIEISVMDNGVGMDDMQVQRFMELLHGDEPGIKNEYNWQSIGLKNVHDRIRYLYGEEFGIQLTSNMGVGTIVQVLLPYNEYTEEGEEKCSG